MYLFICASTSTHIQGRTEKVVIIHTYTHAVFISILKVIVRNKVKLDI